MLSAPFRPNPTRLCDARSLARVAFSTPSIRRPSHTVTIRISSRRIGREREKRLSRSLLRNVLLAINNRQGRSIMRSRERRDTEAFTRYRSGGGGSLASRAASDASLREKGGRSFGGKKWKKKGSLAIVKRTEARATESKLFLFRFEDYFLSSVLRLKGGW